MHEEQSLGLTHKLGRVAYMPPTHALLYRSHPIRIDTWQGCFDYATLTELKRFDIVPLEQIVVHQRMWYLPGLPHMGVFMFRDNAARYGEPACIEPVVVREGLLFNG